MMRSLANHGVSADMVVGSSVGALNGAFYAGDPTPAGVERLADIWRGLQRQDVFPLSLRTLVGFLWRRDFLIPHDGIRKLIDDHIPYRNLEEAKLPVHIVTTTSSPAKAWCCRTARPRTPSWRRRRFPGLSRRSATGT